MEGGDEEYLSNALNFMTFGNISQKVMAKYMLFFSLARQFGQIRKNHFLLELKKKIVF